MQVIYLKDGRIFTTGFSRMSERQYALWNGVSWSIYNEYLVVLKYNPMNHVFLYFFFVIQFNYSIKVYIFSN